MKWLFSGIAFLGALGVSCAQGLETIATQSVVVSNGQAYALLPPVAVAPSGVRSMIWSPNGQHLAIVRKETVLNESTAREGLADPSSVRGSTIVSIWSAKTQKSSEIKRFTGAPPALALNFLTDSDTLLIAVEHNEPQGTRSQLLRYSVGASRLSTLLEGKPPRIKSLGVSASPTMPIALVMLHGSGESTDVSMTILHKVGPAGGLSPAIPVQGVAFHWSRDGRSVALATTTESGRDKVFLEIQTLAIRKYHHKDLYWKPNPLEAAHLRLSFTVWGVSGNPEGYEGLAGLLAAGEPNKHGTALIAAEIESHQTIVAPDLGAIAYVSGGVGLVRPIMKLTVGELEGLLAAAERTARLSDAKSMATAVQMFLADNDDRFPDSERFSEQMMPYLKDNKLISRFVYTYQGGDLSTVAEPSKTEIGYIDGPGGRAVAYADGSARWIKN